jgi:hypothetical protein
MESGVVYSFGTAIVGGRLTKEWARIKFPISDHVMPAQAGTQFFSIRCEIRWVPACAGMTETNDSWFKSGSYSRHDSKLKRIGRGR